MERLKTRSPEERAAVISELKGIGCCDLCVLRYLGISDPEVYKNENICRNILDNFDKSTGESNGENANDEEQNKNKILKRNPCSACLGLLENGIQEEWLGKIVKAVKESEIEAKSFSPALSLPISIQIRAYSIWFHMKKKFNEIFTEIESMKPDVIGIKSVWKWVYVDKLRLLVNPDSEWIIEGTTAVQISTTYGDEREDCKQLDDYLQNVKKIKKKRGGDIVTRGTVESTYQNMKSDEFLSCFKSPPAIPNQALKFKYCDCSHSSIFVAGRYCKYSRQLSQTPWVLDGVRKTESSVEELISNHIVPFLKGSDSKFLSSGREDVDVRTLGNGRPFAVEVLNPKKTIFSREQMLELQKKINSSTDLISVNSIQIASKEDIHQLKHGEESKTKNYCALCSTLGIPVTQEMMDTLNTQTMPLVLNQRTPIRVLHRRTSADRPRSIYKMHAEIVPGHSDIFTLRVETQAGTYVKELVHGDFGRTLPNISSLLGVNADIFALDVEEVNLDWPARIDTDEKTMEN